MNPTATSPYGHDGVVERTAEGGVIHFERELPYSVDEVWDAVTRPERLAEWWLPFDANISIDLRPGGQMTFEGVGDEPVAMTCEILKVDPPRDCWSTPTSTTRSCVGNSIRPRRAVAFASVTS